MTSKFPDHSSIAGINFFKELKPQNLAFDMKTFVEIKSLICELLILIFLFISCDCSESISADQENLDKDIFLVATSSKRWTGLAVSNTSRLFVNYPNWSADHSISVAEVNGNSEATPYPDAEWNSWMKGMDPATHFICVQSVFIDKNNFLWVVDAANIQRDGEYKGVVDGGAKLVKIDLVANAVVQTIIFQQPVIKPTSYLNDIRIDEVRNIAYLTDSNEGAIIVVDLVAGTSRRVLSNDASTKSENKILTVEGEPYRNGHGEYPVIHADGIALNADRTQLYWRALTGESLYRVATSAINDASLSEADLSTQVDKLGPFPSSDGMIFGYYNDLYMASVEENAIRAYDGGNDSRLIRQSKDLKWPDSFSLGADGYLYFTTSQIHITHPSEPYKIFKIQVRF